MPEKMTDEELDAFINDELEKDITQEESIDKKRVDQQLGEMGFLYDRVIKKLNDDKICFSCKRSVDIKKENIQVLEAGKTDKGVVAFVGVCVDCFNKLEKESEQKDKDSGKRK